MGKSSRFNGYGLLAAAIVDCAEKFGTFGADGVSLGLPVVGAQINERLTVNLGDGAACLLYTSPSPRD